MPWGKLADCTFQGHRGGANCQLLGSQSGSLPLRPWWVSSQCLWDEQLGQTCPARHWEDFWGCAGTRSPRKHLGPARRTGQSGGRWKGRRGLHTAGPPLRSSSQLLPPASPCLLHHCRLSPQVSLLGGPRQRVRLLPTPVRGQSWAVCAPIAMGSRWTLSHVGPLAARSSWCSLPGLRWEAPAVTCNSGCRAPDAQPRIFSKPAENHARGSVLWVAGEFIAEPLARGLVKVFWGSQPTINHLPNHSPPPLFVRFGEAAALPQEACRTATPGLSGRCNSRDLHIHA